MVWSCKKTYKCSHTDIFVFNTWRLQALKTNKWCFDVSFIAWRFVWFLHLFLNFLKKRIFEHFLLYIITFIWTGKNRDSGLVRFRLNRNNMFCSYYLCLANSYSWMLLVLDEVELLKQNWRIDANGLLQVW